MIVTCQTCGKEIESERASRKFCDECRKDRKKAVTARTGKQWYQERGIEYHKRWRDEHPEYRANAVKRATKRHKDNPELKKQADARYYQRHKEQIKAQTKAYAQENRNKLRPKRHAQVVRYRAKLAKAEGDWAAEQFLELCEAVDWHCAYCHKRCNKLTADHIFPLSRGGSNDITNIIPACGPCNCSKRDKTPLEYFTRFRI